MRIDMLPAYRLLVAEHRAMVHGEIGPLDRWADEILARVARLDDDELSAAFTSRLPVDASEDHADPLGPDGGR